MAARSSGHRSAQSRLTKAIMTTANDWHGIIASGSHLSPDVARQLRDVGFVVMPGPVITGGNEQLSEAYDRAVVTAAPVDVHGGRTGSSTRISDLIEGRSSMGSTFTRHYWPLVVRSLAGPSSSAACARERSIPAHQRNGFMWTSSIEAMAGHWLAAF